MKKLLTLILLLNVSLFGASFDCAKAQSNVEKMICADEKLAKLDSELFQIYSDFYFLSKEIKGDQREWMKQRNQCKNIVCIQKTYEIRIADLTMSLNNEKTFPKTYLDAMKKAQTTMLRIDPNKLLGKNLYDAKQNKAFEEDFFRFRNITFKPPLISEVKDYNDPKLKEILGECHGYRFDLDVVRREIRILELDPSSKMYLSPDPKFNLIRNPVIDFNLYIWKLNAKGKEWLFVRPKLTEGYYFVLDPNYCTKLRYDGDVAQALNKDKKQIKHSYMPFGGEARIITYKNKDYGLALKASDNRVYLWVSDLLEIQKYWKPLEMNGESYAAITFEINNFKF